MVHAVKGERAAYRPIATPLASSSAPLDVVAGLMALAAFRTLYVADLDAITGVGGHGAEIDAIRRAFPALDLWVDAGEADPARVRERAQANRGTSIVGTESLADAAAAVLAEPGVILSLDHDGAGPLGPAAVHGDAMLWPERVIVMTLARVGSGQGPDLDALALVAGRAGGCGIARRIYAAGGVRGPQDLDALAAAGAAGVLVATALHDGRIDPATARAWA